VARQTATQNQSPLQLGWSVRSKQRWVSSGLACAIDVDQQSNDCRRSMTDTSQLDRQRYTALRTPHLSDTATCRRADPPRWHLEQLPSTLELSYRIFHEKEELRRLRNFRYFLPCFWQFFYESACLGDSPSTGWIRTLRTRRGEESTISITVPSSVVNRSPF
jgi:hypothetical protein